jgi:hypothetical protein
MTCSRVIDLCCPMSSGLVCSRLMFGPNVAVEEAHQFTPRDDRQLVDRSDAISRKKGRITDVSKKRSVKAK